MSKTILPLTREEGAPTYWRSAAHQQQHPSIRAKIEGEFPEGVDEPAGASRRSFLGLIGASMAAVGVAGCIRRPEEKIIPYQKTPEGLIPGIPQFYASAVSSHGEAIGVLVESHEGRPTKLEGNPDHPSSLGGTTPWMQGLALDLYDPDRLQTGLSAGKEAKADDALAALRAQLKRHEKDGGAKLRVLSETTTSPSVLRLRRALLARFPQAKVHTYDGVDVSQARAATKLAFGTTVRAVYQYDRARVVVSVDGDFLGTEPGSIVAAKWFARHRRVQRADATARMSRLWVAEPALTVTGMNADHRARMPASQAEEFLLALGAELAKKGVSFGPLAAKLKPSGVVDEKFVTTLAADLTAQGNRGATVVYVGSRQPPHVQALGLAINEALGNLGKTVKFTKIDGADDPVSDLKSLTDDLNKGAVETLVSLGGNPVYTAPGDVPFGEALKKAAFSFHLGTHEDETAMAATWAAPRAHELEQWGDLRAHDGTVTIVQPLIAPIFGGKSELELLAWMNGAKDPKGHDLVRETFLALGAAVPAALQPGHAATPVASASASASAHAASASASASAAHAASASASASASAAPLASASASASAVVAAASASGVPVPPAVVERHDKVWRRALHDGLFRAQPNFIEPKLDADAVAKAVGSKPGAAPSAGALEVTFAPDPGVLDGRFANVSWMLELPHPVTKTVWDNPLWISVKLAEAQGLESGDVVRLTVGGRSVDLPVWVVPGMADFSAAVHLGWGRKRGGRVAEGRGFDVGPLRSAASPGIATGATLTKTGNRYMIVVTQEHQMLEGREIVLENTLEGLKKQPDFTKHAVHHPPLLPLWTEYKYEGHKWGMIIDLSACTGCSTCVIACQAENNIPTVGKEQVSRQREMHWIRIDRYFSGSLENPQVVSQPMACVHCENAPCENVCPVNATSHSPEGLNEMVYNRCIGTRYCSNNCPYKTRRFNFLDFHEVVPETVKMVANPNVTVRMRGVMEKCTYCVQRIQAAKIAAKREVRRLRDGDVVPACQQACPSDAIMFGDLNDRTSRVARQSVIQHKYEVLAELATKPRTSYLAKIRNPHPDMPATTEPKHSEHG
ncbi:MAG: TAT-variant-translocated molybdopterin oxidoreductase [Polyangiaceae bacterium]|nr:TAT-variant-translocated molybdopterin oxidoreductase [Polyangiaceae bacterium]